MFLGLNYKHRDAVVVDVVYDAVIGCRNIAASPPGCCIWWSHPWHIRGESTLLIVVFVSTKPHAKLIVLLNYYQRMSFCFQIFALKSCKIQKVLYLCKTKIFKNEYANLQFVKSDRGPWHRWGRTGMHGPRHSRDKRQNHAQWDDRSRRTVELSPGRLLHLLYNIKENVAKRERFR